MWHELNEYVLTDIFEFLTIAELARAAQTCRHWYQVSRDDLLWRRLFHRRFLPGQIFSHLSPGCSSWRAEYKRLDWNAPTVACETLKEGHDDQVTHVAFSHDGGMFATCGKDAQVIVWASSHPCTRRFSADLSSFGWQFAQYAEFNPTDSMLMVSGVLVGNILGRISGEIIVFSIEEDFSIKSRIATKPYDTVGCWYNSQYIISSDFKWLAHLVSASMLWMNKVNFTLDSDYTLACMRKLYKFYNPAGNAARHITVAQCAKNMLASDPRTSYDPDERLARALAAKESIAIVSETIPQSDDVPFLPDKKENIFVNMSRFDRFVIKDFVDDEIPPGFIHEAEYFMQRALAFESGEDEECWVYGDEDDEEGDEGWEYWDEEEERRQREDKPEYIKLADCPDEILNEDDKLLIFTTGTRSFVPHQIAIRRMSRIRFRKHMDFSCSLVERIAEQKQKKRLRQRELTEDPRIPNWQDYSAVSDMFDHIDHLFEMQGYIQGFNLSPDSRFLYVCARPWPRGYVIGSAVEPPASGEAVEVCVIDLSSFSLVGRLAQRQWAFVSRDSYPAMFPSVTKNYFAMPVDYFAALWDRHFGVQVFEFHHEDSVNCIAVNPRDQQMAVTAAEDHSLRVWRSKEAMTKHAIKL